MALGLTKKEVADQLQVSERTIDYLRAQGELICVRIGRLIRFLPEDVDSYLYRNRVVPVPLELEKKPTE